MYGVTVRPSSTSRDLACSVQSYEHGQAASNDRTNAKQNLEVKHEFIASGLCLPIGTERPKWRMRGMCRRGFRSTRPGPWAAARRSSQTTPIGGRTKDPCLDQAPIGNS
jgi:hypothetical protein